MFSHDVKRCGRDQENGKPAPSEGGFIQIHGAGAFVIPGGKGQPYHVIAPGEKIGHASHREEGGKDTNQTAQKPDEERHELAGYEHGKNLLHQIQRQAHYKEHGKEGEQVFYGKRLREVQQPSKQQNIGAFQQGEEKDIDTSQKELCVKYLFFSPAWCRAAYRYSPYFPHHICGLP